MTNYRTRPVRIAHKTSKPNVLPNEHSASLLDWLRCYPQMRRPERAKMWFANMRFSVHELRAAHEAGFEVLADALGFRAPLPLDSTPVIVAIVSNKPDISEAILLEGKAA